jgi:hypothetical protein
MQQAIQTFDTKFFPGGVPATPYPDRGTRDYEWYCSEAYAEFFAFCSLVDQDEMRSSANAERARKLLMYVMNEAAKGKADDVNGVEVPFRGAWFSSFNRANYWGEAFGLTVDWIYPVLTAQDKRTIRSVYLRWSQEQLGAYPMMRFFPSLTNPPHSPLLLGVNESEQQQLRWVANNYYAGHARNMTLWALSFDAADDPPVDAQLPESSLGNSLRSWITNITGGWLYQQYALYEDSAVVAKDYGLNTSNSALGKAAGGLPVEGTLYGFSIGLVMQELFALHTAGYADIARVGPQMKLLTSSFWDKHVDGFLHSITPRSRMPYAAQDRYMGQVYEPACYGDVLRYWVNFQSIENFGPIALYDIATGNSARLAKLRWICKDALEGGAAHFLQRAGSVWSDVHTTLAILYFLMYDPADQNTIDPRPSLPTDFYQAPIGRVLSRTDWSDDARWFTFLNPWLSINHINATGGQFEFYRKGEWLTKQWSGYANIAMEGCEHFNTLSVKNDRPQYLNEFERFTDSLGGQWTNGQSAGDPKTRVSFAKDYVFVDADMTNLYNSRNARDVRTVTRSIVWLKPDHLVVYDHAATGTYGRFKRFHLSLLGYPEIRDRVATITSEKGQQLFINSLAPATASFTEQHLWSTDPSKEYNAVAWNEPCKYRIMIEDTTADTRFLTVLQGADPGASRTTATMLVADSDHAEGATLGTMAVLFPKHGSIADGLSYKVPIGVTGHIVAGMRPFAGYAISMKGAGLETAVTISPGGPTQADSAGVLAFGTAVVTSIETPPGTPTPMPARPLSFEISPNPTAGPIDIHILSEGSSFDVAVYDALGQVKQHTRSDSKSVRFDVSILPPGCYLCVVRSEGQTSVRKFLVR